MAITAVSGVTKRDNWTHFSRYEDPLLEEKDKTKWVLGAIDPNVRAHLGDITLLHTRDNNGNPAMMDRSATRNIEAVRFGLRGVENYKDPDGNEIPLTFVDRLLNGTLYKIVDDTFLSTMPPLVIGELGEEILTNNTMTEALRKKLLTP